MTRDTVAAAAAGVKGTYATQARDAAAAPLCQLPNVLARMPASCSLVFGAFATLADAGRCLTTTVRELARWTGVSRMQTWRAVRRLERARLIRRVSVGDGGSPSSVSIWYVTWSFPHPPVPLSSDNVPEKYKDLELQRHGRAPTHQTGAARPPEPPLSDGEARKTCNLDLPPSWRGYQRAMWAVRAAAADLPREAQAALMAPLGAVLHAAAFAKRPRLRSLAELTDAADFIAGRLRSEGLAEVAARDSRAVYSWAGHLVAEAVAEVAAWRRINQAARGQAAAQARLHEGKDPKQAAEADPGPGSPRQTGAVGFQRGGDVPPPPPPSPREPDRVHRGRALASLSPEAIAALERVFPGWLAERARGQT